MTQDIEALLKKVDDWAQASTDCSNDKQAVFLRQIAAAIRELQADASRMDALQGISVGVSKGNMEGTMTYSIEFDAKESSSLREAIDNMNE